MEGLQFSVLFFEWKKPIGLEVDGVDQNKTGKGIQHTRSNQAVDSLLGGLTHLNMQKMRFKLYFSVTVF
jgi:hypothetical protein